MANSINTKMVSISLPWETAAKIRVIGLTTNGISVWTAPENTAFEIYFYSTDIYQSMDFANTYNLFYHVEAVSKLSLQIFISFSI